MQSLNLDAIIRGGLTRFTDQLGKLWCSLADYYIRSGHFEKVPGQAGVWERGRAFFQHSALGDTCGRAYEQKTHANVLLVHTFAHSFLKVGQGRLPGPASEHTHLEPSNQGYHHGPVLAWVSSFAEVS